MSPKNELVEVINRASQGDFLQIEETAGCRVMAERQSLSSISDSLGGGWDEYPESHYSLMHCFSEFCRPLILQERC